MRAVSLVALCVAGLSGCGGGSDGGGATGFDPNQARREAVDFLERADGNNAQVLSASDLPTKPVELEGTFATRIGHTETALMGEARMTADFDASKITGSVNEMGIFDVRGVSLFTAEATNERGLGGKLSVNGTIVDSQPDVPGATFDAVYRGKLTGWPEKGGADVSAATHGATFTEDGGLVQGYGQVDGSVAFDGGGSETLTNGFIFVKE